MLEAIGAINELVRRKIPVPEMVRVTGIEQSRPWRKDVVPITSVTSEMRAAGQRAVETLLEKIEGRPASPVVIEPRLFLRTSSGAARSEAERAAAFE